MPPTRIAAAAMIATCFFSTIASAQTRRKAVSVPSSPAASHGDATTAAPLGAWRIDLWEDVMESSTLTDMTSGYHAATTTKAFYGSASFNTVLDGLVDLNDVKISYAETTDSTPIVELASVPLFSPQETDGRCVYGPAGAVTMMVCRKPEKNLTTVTITRQSQDVTYHAEESGKNNVDTHEVTGPQTRLGATASMNVTLVAGQRTWAAQATMTLVPVERNANEPRNCAGATCTQNSLHGISKTGFAAATQE
jgi:hypothetical protein